MRVHVAIGGAAGSLARVGVDQLSDRMVASAALPTATFLVNVSGALALGLLLARTEDPRWRALVGTGLLGAWTTFSTLAIEVDALLRTDVALGLAYVAATLGAGLAAARVGRLTGEATT